MRHVSLAAVGVSAALMLASSASAGIITASFTKDLDKNVTITRNGDTSTVRTVAFHWVRSDAPGPGIDPFIPVSFDTYCVDLDQTVQPNHDYTFEVISMVDAGYSDEQRLLLRRLWASFKGLIDNAVESAAFQSAIWEILYDTDKDGSTGAFTIDNPAPVKSLAQSYLDTVNDPLYAGNTVSLVVLRSESAQDQITVIPTPGSLALFGLGACFVARRRK